MRYARNSKGRYFFNRLVSTCLRVGIYPCSQEMLVTPGKMHRAPYWGGLGLRQIEIIQHLHSDAFRSWLDA